MTKNKKKNNTNVTIKIEEKKTQKKNVNKNSKRVPVKQLLGLNANPDGSVGTSFRFAEMLTEPDVFGPCRIPRVGGSPKTGLGMDRTQYQITGSATNTIQGAVVGTVFNTNCAQALTATTSNTVFSSSSIAVGTQFPAAANMDDVSLVSASMLVSYLSSPLNAAGEIILGQIAYDQTSLTTAKYNNLYFYPGFIKVPVATLVEKPLRVFLTKASNAANDFVALSTGVADCNIPIIVTSGLPTGATVNVEITRCWEYRTSIAAGNTVPYEITTNGHSSDLASYQDTQDTLSREPACVEEGVSEYVREMALGAIGSRAGPLINSIGTASLGWLSNRMMNRVRLGRV